MKINPQTRLSRVLDLDPRVVEYIVSLNPHDFDRLNNPLMRRFMAGRITLGRVAAMVDRPVEELLEHIAQLVPVDVEMGAAGALPQSPAERPAWAAAEQPPAQEVDLLEMDRRLDADPLPPIVAALKQLAPGDVLLIRHKWEPQPFFDIWAKLGDIDWFSQQVGADEWHIWVRRREA